MKLIDAGFGHVTREMEGRLHQHPEDHEFHYFVARTGLFLSLGAQIQAARGTLFFTRPGELHDTLPGGTRSTSLYYLRLLTLALFKGRSQETHLMASTHHWACRRGPIGRNSGE